MRYRWPLAITIGLAALVGAVCFVKARSVNADPLAGRADRLVGERAVAFVKSVLEDFGTKDPIVVKSITPPSGLSRPNWFFRLQDQSGVRFDACYDGRSSRLLNVFASNRTLYVDRLHMFTPVTDARKIAHITSWIPKVSGSEALGAVRLVECQNEPMSAKFPVLRKGHPPLDRQPYFYRMDFQENPPQLLFFEAPERIPEVDPRPAVLTQAKARAAFKHFFYAERKFTEPIPEYDLAHAAHRPSELVYAKVKGDKKAHLVWSFDYVQECNPHLGLKGGSRTMLIDAVTGKRLEVPDYL
jgi:hypothetical protein